MRKSEKLSAFAVMTFFLAGLLAAMVFSGCATEQAVKNLSQKNLVGDGFVAVSKISISDPENGDFTPIIKTFIINGKVLTILKDANLLNYTRNSSASVFNASSITTTETLTISVPQGKNLEAVVKAMEEVIRPKEK